MARCTLVITLLALLPQGVAQACSLCGLEGLKEQGTLREDLTQAKLILLFGHIANPRFTDDRVGAGVTDLRILRVLKDNGTLGKRATIQLDRYIPILDEKNPPQFVIFCDVVEGKLDPYRGRAVQTPAVLQYIKDIDALKHKDRRQQLQFYFAHLDHADELIAEDAFLEFARSSDREVGDISASLTPARLRKLLANPQTPSERISLFAFLLGGCGGEQDAALLCKLIDSSSPEGDRNLDGFLSGYIHLRPNEGWELAYQILSDRERPFLQQFAAVRTLRFYHGWKPEETHRQVLRCHACVLVDGEIADLAIEDLRRWKIWELTDVALAQYGQESHKAPITQRALVRYALSCPLPQARAFVQRLEEQPEKRELLHELREGLAVEKE
jgi:hypothetical protein